MDRPIESETTKIVENSYRATILAFMNEWSLFAERNGVDLIKVIKAIKMRPTHSNMIFPGPGVGGYCLPKDAGLGYWAYKHILGFEDGDEVFKISPTAVDINDTRALHVAELTRDALRNMGRYIAGADVLVCGASYRQDVGDTRYSGSEMVVRKLTEMGAEMRVHDPYVDHWFELEQQDVYPSPGHSWSRFFHNQEGLKDIRVQKDLAAALNHAEALILAVPHEQYLDLDPDQIVKWAGGPLAVIDCFGILSDEQIRRYFELGCEVKALGRGHIQRIKETGAGESEVGGENHAVPRNSRRHDRRKQQSRGNPEGDPPIAGADDPPERHRAGGRRQRDLLDDDGPRRGVSGVGGPAVGLVRRGVDVRPRVGRARLAAPLHPHPLALEHRQAGRRNRPRLRQGSPKTPPRPLESAAGRLDGIGAVDRRAQQRSGEAGEKMMNAE